MLGRVSRSVAAHRVRNTSGTRNLPLQQPHDVPEPGRAQRRTRTPKPAESTGIRGAHLLRTWSQRSCGAGDITKLSGPRRTWFSLYVVLNVYSRFVVSWLFVRRESSFLATRLIRTGDPDARDRSSATHDSCGPRRVRQVEDCAAVFRAPALRTRSGRSHKRVHHERRHGSTCPEGPADARAPRVPQVVLLDWPTPHFGGARWWLHCPRCERRCGCLYLPDPRGSFACCRCHGRVYRSQQEHDPRISRLMRDPGALPEGILRAAANSAAGTLPSCHTMLLTRATVGLMEAHASRGIRSRVWTCTGPPNVATAAGGVVGSEARRHHHRKRRAASPGLVTLKSSRRAVGALYGQARNNGEQRLLGTASKGFRALRLRELCVRQDPRWRKFKRGVGGRERRSARHAIRPSARRALAHGVCERCGGYRCRSIRAPIGCQRRRAKQRRSRIRKCGRCAPSNRRGTGVATLIVLVASSPTVPVPSSCRP